MRPIKLYFIVLVCLVFSVGYAQEKKYDISAPTDLKETGVNKVLCMSNGNTVLFHFEPTKAITVVIFDSTHKQIENRKEWCRIFDVYTIAAADFKGLYEINGEAVLFFGQEHLSKYRLIMQRYNVQNGLMIEEKIVAESQSLSKPLQCCVMKNKGEDNYAILFCTDNPLFKKCDVFVRTYNKLHESINDVKLIFDRKKYDNIYVIGAESKPNGVIISLDLVTLVQNGTTLNINSDGASIPDVNNHDLLVFYIPEGSSTATATSVNLSTQVLPLYTNYTYNAFAKKLNLLFSSYREGLIKNGLEWIPADDVKNIFFDIDEASMSIDHKWLQFKTATAELRQKRDSLARYEGLPINMFTNEYGLSTVISQSFSKSGDPESNIRYGKYTYFGSIGITQVGDDGNEIWGTVLPLNNAHKSYKHYYSAYDLSKKWQNQALFGDLPEAVYERQFVSINAYCHDKNFYIIFNDVNKNFNNTIEHPGDTVYSFATTNACYYKMNRKKEISKHYLYGEPAADEYKCSFIEGADFDEKRGVYASLVQYKNGKNISLCMAWSHLD